MARMKKSTKQYLFISIVLLVVVIGVGVSVVLLMNKRIRSTYGVQLEEKELYVQENTRVVYRTLRDISAGEIIKADDVEVLNLLDAEDPALFFDAGDLHEEKVALVDVPKGTHLLKFMVNQQGEVGDLREVQYNAIAITDNVSVNDVVDVRLSFPNGEDFVVLSQKEMKSGGLEDGGGCFLWLSEEEILLMSAAMVDAYLYTGSSIYTTKYIAPTIQDASVVNYTPSVHIIDLIYDDPNIVQEASTYLSIKVRKELESRLADSLDVDVKDKDWTVTEEDLQMDAIRENERTEYEESVTPVTPTLIPTPTPTPTPTPVPAITEGVEFGE